MDEPAGQPAMNCNGFESELRNAVERRESAGGELRAHAEACPRCGTRWEQHMLLDSAITAWKGGVPHTDLADAVMAHWAFDAGAQLSERLAPAADHDDLAASSPRSSQPGAAVVAASLPPARRHVFRSWAVPGTAVAVLAILLSALFWHPNGNEGRDAPHVADDAGPRNRQPDRLLEGAAPAPAVAAQQPVRLDTAVREAGSAWMGLASEATGTVREMAAFLPERTFATAAGATPDGSPSRPDGWTDRLRNELAPIQRDMGKAMDFLWEAVPLSRDRAI